MNITRHAKRWLALAVIYFFTVYIPLGWLFMVISLADEIDVEIEHGLSWLFPGDWVKVRFAMVWLGVVLCIGMAIISTLGRT